MAAGTQGRAFFIERTTIIPVLAAIALALTWGRKDIPVLVEVLVAALLIGAVLSAVHHAEVLAHRLGEPFGSLLLAVAVTVIEVGLIVMLMLGGGPGTDTLARDTVFAAVMITCNGIAGLSLVVAAVKHHVPSFRFLGSASALSTVVGLTGITMVLPRFTVTSPGDSYSPSQLAFVAIASATLWFSFVFTQTVKHRDFFLPEELQKASVHAERPSNRASAMSLGVLMISLVAVVGLAKVLSPAIEAGVSAAGLPHAVVGVVIALVVLLPESLAAINNARRNRVQVSLNLAYGSAIASIGLTIPTIAIVSSMLGLPFRLGLGNTQLALVIITFLVSSLTIAGGKATRQEGVILLVILASYVFLTAVP